MILSHLGGSSLKDFHVLLKKKKKKKSLIFHAHVRVKIICLGSISYMVIQLSLKVWHGGEIFFLCVCGGKLNTNFRICLGSVYFAEIENFLLKVL